MIDNLLYLQNALYKFVSTLTVFKLFGLRQNTYTRGSGCDQCGDQQIQ